MNEEKIFIRNVKNYMAEKKLSNAEFSKRTGIDVYTLGNLLKEKKQLSMLYMKRIKEATGMSFVQLFTPDFKQLKGANAQEVIAEGNKDFLIEQQKIQIEKLKENLERLREEMETKEQILPAEIVEAPMPVLDKTLRLSICNGASAMHLNGVSVPLENIEDTDLLKKQVMVTMVFDEILIK